MGHLVADHNADSAIVHRLVGIRIEERRLKDGCREADFVGCRIVVGIHRLRSHPPFGTVCLLAKLGLVVLDEPPAGGKNVVVVAVGLGDGHRSVILPLVRVADLDREIVKLFVGLGLGGVAHPVKRIDVLAEGSLQVGHE